MTRHAHRDRAYLHPDFQLALTPSPGPIPVVNVTLTETLTVTVATFTIDPASSPRPDAAPGEEYTAVTIGGPVPPLPPLLIVPTADGYRIVTDRPAIAEALIAPRTVRWLTQRHLAGEPVTLVLTANWILTPTRLHPTSDAAVTFLRDALKHLRFDRALAVHGRTDGWVNDTRAAVLLEQCFPVRLPEPSA